MLSNTIDITAVSLLYEVAARSTRASDSLRSLASTAATITRSTTTSTRTTSLANLRLVLPKGQPLPSISHIFFAAVIVEKSFRTSSASKSPTWWSTMAGDCC